MTPLEVACCHSPTDAELERDPAYIGCMAAPGQLCKWADRADGVVNPPFHSERIEAACTGDGSPAQISEQDFDAAVLASGLF